ncbi:unnamed protein product [Mucor hiemalis]
MTKKYFDNRIIIGSPFFFLPTSFLLFLHILSMPKPLIVQFTPIRSCLVNLPSKWVNALLNQNKLPQNVILEIVGVHDNKRHPTKKVYCGWSGEASKPLSPNSVFTHGANGKLTCLKWTLNSVLL